MCLKNSNSIILVSNESEILKKKNMKKNLESLVFLEF